ncbi:hypothetical protein [Leptospira noguchii]|uniref:hypothetical protein n=1 Tax=Leptospira noguchii TaxID=28182 RepID=UPI003D768166
MKFASDSPQFSYVELTLSYKNTFSYNESLWSIRAFAKTILTLYVHSLLIHFNNNRINLWKLPRYTVT